MTFLNNPLFRQIRNRLNGRAQNGDPRPLEIDTSRRFLEVHMDITSRCNLACPFCYRHDYEKGSGDEIERGILEKIAERVFPHSHTVYLSCNSEPLLTRHFEYSLQLTNKYGVENTRFHTNAAPLNQSKALMCIENNVESIIVSFESTDAEKFAYFREGTTMERVFHNVDQLRRLRDERGLKRPEIHFQMLIMRSNIDDWCKMADLAREHGAQKIFFIHMLPINQSMRDDCLFYHQQECNDGLARLREHVKDWGIPAGIPRDFYFQRSGEAENPPPQVPCNLPWNQLYLDIDGNAKPCTLLFKDEFGSILEQDLRALYNNDAFREIRMEHIGGKFRKTCAHCLYKCDYESELSFYDPFDMSYTKDQSVSIDEVRRRTPTLKRLGSNQAGPS